MSTAICLFGTNRISRIFFFKQSNLADYEGDTEFMDECQCTRTVMFDDV